MIRPAALPLLFFASGALALAYEVLWQRRFALVFGGGAPAAAAVLAAYFAGLGVGSYVVGRAAARVTRPLRVSAVLEALVAVGALASFPSGRPGSRERRHGRRADRCRFRKELRDLFLGRSGPAPARHPVGV